MEFCYASYLNTSTQLTVSNNTILAGRIISFDETRQYVTDGDDSDLTVTTITITLDETTTIDRIILRSINWKQFTAYYNGTTANVFNMTTTAATTTTDFANNSETSMVLSLSSTPISTVTFDVYTTQVADSEKAVGNIILTAQKLSFSRLPDSSGYKPSKKAIEISHELADGGTRIQFKSEKGSADIKLKHVTEAFRNSLRTVWREKSEMIFIAFPTSTAWDEFAMPCVWGGDFEFYTFSNNNPNAGFNGTIKLRETPL